MAIPFAEGSMAAGRPPGFLERREVCYVVPHRGAGEGAGGNAEWLFGEGGQDGAGGSGAVATTTVTGAGNGVGGAGGWLFGDGGAGADGGPGSTGGAGDGGSRGNARLVDNGGGGNGVLDAMGGNGGKDGLLFGEDGTDGTP